jgi:hypothetical protein
MTQSSTHGVLVQQKEDRMKISFLSFVAVAVLIAAFAGCKNDDGTGTDDAVTVTADDAADALASAFAGSQATVGLSTQLEEAATLSGGGTLGKIDGTTGMLFDTTVTRSRDGAYSYSYTVRYSYSFVNANRFTFAYGMKGAYATPRMTSSDSAGATLEVSNILTGPSYLVAGIYNRYGTQASKIRLKISFKSTITVAFTTVLIDKSTKRISSGTATITIYGQSSTGSIYSYSATLVFLGNQQATLVIGSKTYTLNLALGEATAV